MRAPVFHRIRVIDSHTAGEPTRVVLDGGPDLGSGSVADQRAVFSEQYKRFRSAVICEPRGAEAWVGALLCPTPEAACVTGVIFFNNVGCLGMCGHGAMGVVATLAHVGRIAAGEHCLDTPAGIIRAHLHTDGSVSVDNVPCWRQAAGVRVEVPGYGAMTGDVAYGGNWFYLVGNHGQTLATNRIVSLVEFAKRIRAVVNTQGYPEVDHVELLGPATTPGAHARNFVLCPGGAFDRSPCGTGTSAKLACLATAGEWPEHQTWVQEGILGTTFTGQYRWLDRAAGRLQPRIRGTAYITGESTLLLDERDPFRWGI